jgi:hypothetical protein
MSAVAQSIRFLAVVAVAICLIPAGAHFFELSNKMALSPADYMTVQTIYAGWAFFGIAIFAAIALTLAHSIMVRQEGAALFWSVVAFLLLVATQVIFWMFTYPMNAETQNWTVPPPDLEMARRQWEYSHAVNALLTFVAFVAITLSVLAARRDTRE